MSRHVGDKREFSEAHSKFKDKETRDAAIDFALDLKRNNPKMKQKEILAEIKRVFDVEVSVMWVSYVLAGKHFSTSKTAAGHYSDALRQLKDEADKLRRYADLMDEMVLEPLEKKREDKIPFTPIDDKRLREAMDSRKKYFETMDKFVELERKLTDAKMKNVDMNVVLDRVRQELVGVVGLICQSCQDKVEAHTRSLEEGVHGMVDDSGDDGQEGGSMGEGGSTDAESGVEDEGENQ